MSSVPDSSDGRGPVTRTRVPDRDVANEFRTGRSRGNLARTPDMAVVTPLNNPGGPEGDTVTVDDQLLNTEY
jgi:hypothetical protein